MELRRPTWPSAGGNCTPLSQSQTEHRRQAVVSFARREPHVTPGNQAAIRTLPLWRGYGAGERSGLKTETSATQLHRANQVSRAEPAHALRRARAHLAHDPGPGGSSWRPW
jgi:hypothetical protein